MKKLILPMAIFCLLANSLEAGVILGTDTPLTTGAGTTSGSMLVTVYSDNPPNDVMTAWQFHVEIIPISGATGTLMFQDPATGFYDPVTGTPPNYIFGSDGAGIVATNGGNMLSANDFDLAGGVPVSGAPGANLLQMDFSASSDASGLFGIYADEGSANTVWTDSNFNTQFFTNVPDGTGIVLIGEVQVTPGGVQPVPEPSSLTLFWLGGMALASWKSLRKRKQTAA